MKAKQPKVETITYNKHWISWAKGYLNLAQQGFLYLKNKENLGKETKLPVTGKKLYRLGTGSMVIASIWNIKHGIELIVKGLGITLDKNYYKTHDLSFLVNDLDKKMRPHCLKRDIELLKALVNKYYNCDFLKSPFFDLENDYLRYPEIKRGGTSFSLDYSFVHELKRKDVNQFLRDIYNLKLVGDILEGQPTMYQQAEKWGVKKRITDKQLLAVPTMQKPYKRLK